MLQLTSHIEQRKAGRSEEDKNLEIMAMGALELSETPQDPYSIHLAQKLLGVITTNSHTLVTATFDPLGMVLDPLLARANHSCDPNAYIVMDGPNMSLRTLKPLEENEEIFISYVDATNPMNWRRAELAITWYFDCKCSKCARGPQTDKYTRFLATPDKLKKELADAADEMIRENPAIVNNPHDNLGDDVASRRVIAINSIAFDHLEKARKAKDPDTAMEECEEGMTVCHESGIWPLYRQPYAALRHEHALSNLSIGNAAGGGGPADGDWAAPNYANAFSQMATMYFDIDPVLYDVPWHPVRVVHVWTFATLALYLAAPEAQKAVEFLNKYSAKGIRGKHLRGPAKYPNNELDIGVVVWGLLVEVRGNVDKSHGADSSFARTVKSKVDEVKVDMTRAGPERLREAESRIPEVWKALRAIGESPSF